MRATVCRLMGASVPFLLAMAACSGDPTGTTQTAATSTASSAKPTPSATPTTVSGNVFGVGTIRHTGQSGLVNVPTFATDPPRAPGTYRAQVTLTVKGLALGNWTDTRVLNQNPPTQVPLTPQSSRTAPGNDTLRTTGILVYPNLASDVYHFRYADPFLVSAAQPNASGDIHLDMIGFYVSDPLPVYESLKPTDGVFKLSQDLYWDSQSFPFLGSANNYLPGSYGRAHVHGEYITYTQDAFTVKALNTPSPAKYRFVVYPSNGSFQALWYSTWHDPDSTGMVKVSWNGYTSAAGPADTPDENVPANTYLPEGPYLYAVEFKKANGQYPENAPNPRTYDPQDGSYISNFYGGSQLFPMLLKHGTPPTGTPKPTTAPTTTPTPIPTPTAPLFPTFPPFN
jgi:hypothetical protein